MSMRLPYWGVCRERNLGVAARPPSPPQPQPGRRACRGRSRATALIWRRPYGAGGRSGTAGASLSDNAGMDYGIAVVTGKAWRHLHAQETYASQRGRGMTLVRRRRREREDACSVDPRRGADRRGADGTPGPVPLLPWLVPAPSWEVSVNCEGRVAVRRLTPHDQDVLREKRPYSLVADDR